MRASLRGQYRPLDALDVFSSLWFLQQIPQMSLYLQSSDDWEFHATDSETDPKLFLRRRIVSLAYFSSSSQRRAVILSVMGHASVVTQIL